MIQMNILSDFYSIGRRKGNNTRKDKAIFFKPFFKLIGLVNLQPFEWEGKMPDIETALSISEDTRKSTKPLSSKEIFVI